MTKLSIGSALAVLDAISLGWVVEQANWSMVAATLCVSTLTLWPAADELAARLFRGDEN